MAKKKAKDTDPLGKLVAAGGQSPWKLGRVILGGLIVVVGVGLLIAGLMADQSVPLMVAGGGLAMVGGVIVRTGVGFLPIHFEVRKRGIRHRTPHRELEVEWAELDSVFIQMISSNVLLNFTGVGDQAEYIHKRADTEPFQVQLKTKEGQFFSFNSGMLPALSGRDVLDKIAENVPATVMAYQLFVELPKLTDDD